MTTKINTIQQARSIVSRIQSQDIITHHDRQTVTAIEQSLADLRKRDEWMELISRHDARGDVVMRDQEQDNLELWWSERSEMTHRLAGK